MFHHSVRSCGAKTHWIALGFLVLLSLLYHLHEMISVKKQINLGSVIPRANVQDSSSQEMKVTPPSPYILPEGGGEANETASPTPSTEVVELPVVPLVPKDTTIPMAWCVLSINNTSPFFRHFPHALQSLAPCWSFFCRVRAEHGHPELPCGLFLEYPRRVPLWEGMSFWTRQLVEQYMGCRVVLQSKANTPAIGKVIGAGDVQYRRLPNGQARLYEFFEKPEHATLLQARVLGEAVWTETKNKGDPIHIGLLQRIRDKPNRPSRIFLNLPEIRSALQAAFPNAIVEESEMRNFTLQQQAAWWHQKDVVIAGHGAAITNGIFLRNHNHSTAAALIEIYPDGFQPVIFAELLKSVGVHRWAIRQNASVGAGKSADLRPDPQRVVQLVRQALSVGDDSEETGRQ